MNRTIHLAGDSTCAFNDISTYPCTGWGQMLHLFVNPVYKVKNYAMNGRSTKSFINEGRLEEIERNLNKGDILLIQFGHNDQKEDVDRHTEPYSTYQMYLKEYIKVARRNGAIPILMTSIIRRHFNERGNIKTIQEVHGEYPKAVIDLAITERTQFIDMCQLSRNWLASIGDNKSKSYFMNLSEDEFENYPKGLDDNTHLQISGAKKIASIIGAELSKIDLIL